MALIVSSLCPPAGGHTQIPKLISGNHRQHIRGIQFKPHGALGSGFAAAQKEGIAESKARIQIQSPVLVQQASGIKLVGFPPHTDGGTVLIVDITIELEVPRRFIADGYGNPLRSADEIVQVISSIRPFHHIRSGHAAQETPFGRSGVLTAVINAALIPPIRQIIHRRRPADIIAQAKYMPIVPIVGAVNIHPVAEHIRFAVRYILP